LDLRQINFKKLMKKAMHITEIQYLNSVNSHINAIKHMHDLTVNFQKMLQITNTAKRYRSGRKPAFLSTQAQTFRYRNHCAVTMPGMLGDRQRELVFSQIKK
jgi:hypothetical protein